MHTGPPKQDKIACMTGIHSICTPRPCFRPTSFTPLCFHAPYQFIPLHTLYPYFLFDALWFVYLHLFISFLRKYNFLFKLTFAGTQLGYETRPWYTCILNVTTHNNPLSPVG